MKNTMKFSLLTALVLCFTTTFTNTVAHAALPFFKAKATMSCEPLFGGAYLIFGGKTGGKIAKKDFEGQTRLALGGCPGAKESTILRFSLDITKDGKTTTLTSSTDRLTKEMVAKLKALAIGDTFEFKKVMAKWPNYEEEYEVRTQKYIVANLSA